MYIYIYSQVNLIWRQAKATTWDVQIKKGNNIKKEASKKFSPKTAPTTTKHNHRQDTGLYVNETVINQWMWRITVIIICNSNNLKKNLYI